MYRQPGEPLVETERFCELLFPIVAEFAQLALVISLAQQSGFLQGFAGMDVQQLKRQQIITLIVFVALSCPRRNLSKQQKVERLVSAFERRLQFTLSLWQHQQVGATATFSHRSLNIPPTDHAKLRGLANQAVNMFVDLFAKVADRFTAAVFNTNEAHLPDVCAVAGRVGHRLDVSAGTPQQLGHRLVNQRLPCFGACFVTANHILVIAVQHMSVLPATTTGKGSENQTKKSFHVVDTAASFVPSNTVSSVNCHSTRLPTNAIRPLARCIILSVVSIA